MIVVEEKKNRIRLDIETSQEALIEFRKILFENGLSVQEFLAFLFVFSQLKDRNVMQLIDMAKLEKIKNNEKIKISSKPSSSNALYNLLERQSPLLKQR